MPTGTLVISKALLESLTPDGIALIYDWIDKGDEIADSGDDGDAVRKYQLDHPDFVESLVDKNGHYSLYITKKYDGYNFNYVISSLQFYSEDDKRSHIVRRYS